MNANYADLERRNVFSLPNSRPSLLYNEQELMSNGIWTCQRLVYKALPGKLMDLKNTADYEECTIHTVQFKPISSNHTANFVTYMTASCQQFGTEHEESLLEARVV